jgi:hypothetical protein
VLLSRGTSDLANRIADVDRSGYSLGVPGRVLGDRPTTIRSAVASRTPAESVLARSVRCFSTRISRSASRGWP